MTASPETIAARIGEIAQRPNLAVGGDPVGRARDLLAQRADAYAECHLALSTDTLDADAVADTIVALAERDPVEEPDG